MAKAKTIYTCQHCGAQSPKWLGRCPDCGEWNSYVEETYLAPIKPVSGRENNSSSKPQSLEEVDEALGNHIPIGIGELDRVLGGGYVPGSAILVGGSPGIGKSTLLLQVFGKLAAKGKKILYVSGEESAAQIKTRASRLGILKSHLFILTENNLEQILEILKKESFDLVTIDSVQTLYSNMLSSAPGTVSQVRECSGQLITFIKKAGITCFFVGHVTKEGTIAGPKVLEHMVDCVLYFESDPGHTFRILRVVKNRFGTTNEIGLFEMTSQGLQEVSNPSHLFLSHRDQPVNGSVIVASMEGTRSLLLEIQSLVTHSHLANPRRTGIGIDNSRLALLVAVLEKVVAIPLNDQDIFVNIAGGLKVLEPALDLGIATAIYSSFRNAPSDATTVLMGEVGLTGEIRPVPQMEKRLHEVAKLGFKRAILPKENSQKNLAIKNLEVNFVKNLEESLHLLF